MLDASNPESGQQKAKKAKVQTVRPVERFWPDAIASLQPKSSGHNGTDGTTPTGTTPALEASDDSACGDATHSAPEEDSRDNSGSNQSRKR